MDMAVPLTTYSVIYNSVIVTRERDRVPRRRTEPRAEHHNMSDQYY